MGRATAVAAARCCVQNGGRCGRRPKRALLGRRRSLLLAPRMCVLSALLSAVPMCILASAERGRCRSAQEAAAGLAAGSTAAAAALVAMPVAALAWPWRASVGQLMLEYLRHCLIEKRGRRPPTVASQEITLQTLPPPWARLMYQIGRAHV